MTASASASASHLSGLDIGWAARVALRLYPRSWRDEYEHEVSAILLDLADGSPDSSIPAGEVAHLALRGAMLRAKSSLTFWGGLLIVVIMVVFVALQPPGIVVERYWTTILASAGAGLAAALPIAALLGAWQGHRATRGSDARAQSPGFGASARMLQLVTSGLPILGFVVLGYLAAGVTLVVASGLPPTWNADLRLPLAYLFMSAGAIAFGYLIGLVLHAGVAMPLAFVAQAIWFSSGPVWSPSVIGWRDITGVNLSECCASLSDAPIATTLLSVSMLGAGLVALALAVAAVPRGALRVLPVLLGVGIAASALVVMAPTIQPNAALVSGARDPASLTCAGTAPQVCMWPEQVAAKGEHVRELITGAYQKGMVLGLPMRSTVTPLFMTRGAQSEHSTPITQLFWTLADDDDRILTNYAEATTMSAGCRLTTTTAGGFETQLAVEYAIARELGAADAVARPRLARSAEMRLPDTVLNPSEVRTALGVTDRVGMEAVISTWMGNLNACADN